MYIIFVLVTAAQRGETRLHPSILAVWVLARDAPNAPRLGPTF